MALQCSVSAVALLTAGGAMAQTATQTTDPAAADQSTVEEVVVTGIRASLQNAQAIKQNAEVPVDSITAEDIGALPDRSVTEALQRVPGVSMDRFAAGRDPDHFSVEGSGVVIRGLTFVRSEFNGRDAFSATSGHGLSFQDVPAELMAGVDVFKNQSADMVEGGVAGTVNLRTRTPFDATHRVLSFSLENSYGDFAKKWAPTGSVLFSNRWDTGAGEVGLLLDVVHSDLKTRSDGDQVSYYTLRDIYAGGQLTAPEAGGSPIGQGYIPNGAAFRRQEFDHRRDGFAAAAQWRSPDRTMLATLQFLRSASKEAWTEHAVEITADQVISNGGAYNVPGTSVDFGGDGMFESGVITAGTGWADDQNTTRRTPLQGLQSNNIRRDVDARNRTSDIGFNFKWTPNDRFAVNLDYQHVRSFNRNLDVSFMNSTYQDASIQLRGDDPPLVSFLNPSCPAAGCSNYAGPGHTSLSDPANTFVRAFMDHYEESDGTEDAARFDVEYKFDDDSWIQSVRAGGRWAERDLTTRFTAYNWGVVTEQWGGGGPVWLDQTGQAGQFETYGFDNFMRGDAPAPTGSDPRLFYAGSVTSGYNQAVALANQINAQWRANGSTSGFVPLAARPGVVQGTPFLPYEINPTTDTNKAIYAMVRFGHRFDNGMDVSGNVGVRYVKLDRATEGFLAFPAPTSDYLTDAECQAQLDEIAQAPAGGPPQEPSPFCTLTPQVRASVRAFQNGASVPNNQSASFDYVLPSFNLKVGLGGGKLLRFAVSKGITPPDQGLVRNYFNVTLGGGLQDIVNGRPTAPNVTAGNPMLKPMDAINFDASFEWYFSKVGQFSFALFDKELRNVVTNGVQRMTFTNNGETFDAIVTTAQNSTGKGKVRGFEVAYQQVYDFLPGLFSGLGLSATYTYVDAKGVPQSTLNETDPAVAAGTQTNIDASRLPLQGLSEHTINFTPFYEKGPISLRLAYNWRSEYLLTVRDVIAPYAPIMDEGGGQLDASVFYTLNDHLKVGVQAVNLLNQTTRTAYVINNDLDRAGRSWFVNDRRFTIGLRGTF